MNTTTRRARRIIAGLALALAVVLGLPQAASASTFYIPINGTTNQYSYGNCWFYVSIKQVGQYPVVQLTNGAISSNQCAGGTGAAVFGYTSPGVLQRSAPGCDWNELLDNTANPAGCTRNSPLQLQTRMYVPAIAASARVHICSPGYGCIDHDIIVS